MVNKGVDMVIEDRIAALEERVAMLEGAGTRPAQAEWRRAPEALRDEAHGRPAPGSPEPRPSSPTGTGRAERLRSRLPSPVPGAGGEKWPARQRPGLAATDAATPTRGLPTRTPSAPKRDLEDFLGANVLAWLGGVAVLAGLAFLLTIAVSRGWIGEGARTALAGALSLGLLGTGVWLRERRGRYEAALAAAAVGVAGCFGTLVVAGPVYGLLPGDMALLAAFATGAVATALSLRWSARIMGWLGLMGALLAPAALGADEPLYLAIAYAATVAVIVRERWTRLALPAFFIVALQLFWWLWDETPGDGMIVLALAGFGALTTALGFGIEVYRRGAAPVEIGPAPKPRIPWLATTLLAFDAAVLALYGWDLLGDGAWVAVLAAIHVALGLAAVRLPRVSRELALITVAIGVVLADIAFASLTSGLPLVIGWGVSALPFAALLGARRPGHESRIADLILGRPERADRILAMAGLAGQVSLAVFQGLAFDAQPGELSGGIAPGGALAAAGALAVVAWCCARLVEPRWRAALDVLALAALAHFTGLALEGVALTVTLAAQALGLAALARHNGDRITGWAALAFAAVGLGHALGTLATPDALHDGLAEPLAASAALVAVAAAVAAISRVPLADERLREVLLGAAALVLLYLASTGVVTLAGGGQDGQTALSVLWAVAGVGALVAGLLGDSRPLRRGALALLALTAGKVFLYDLSSLTSMYRVGSLIGLGLLLLSGAFAWQHVRPRGAQVR
jgi:uncharacterized membrane protein